ncbi:MAG: hypothetical protein AB8C84_12160 [Oligoflexales bacterium]
MEPLTFETSCKIVEATSSIFQQGDSWVLRVWDLDAGAERLTRGLSFKKASSNLAAWRKKKIDELLRNEPSQKGWFVQVWEENPTWQGAGLWQHAENFWHLTESDAQGRLEELKATNPSNYQLESQERSQIPRHFQIFQKDNTDSPLDASSYTTSSHENQSLALS